MNLRPAWTLQDPVSKQNKSAAKASKFRSVCYAAEAGETCTSNPNFISPFLQSSLTIPSLVSPEKIELLNSLVPAHAPSIPWGWRKCLSFFSFLGAGLVAASRLLLSILHGVQYNLHELNSTCFHCPCPVFCMAYPIPYCSCFGPFPGCEELTTWPEPLSFSQCDPADPGNL